MISGPLFATHGLIVRAGGDSGTIDAICGERQRAYGPDGPGSFGRDAYDDYGEHLFVTRAAGRRPLGAMRLGPGPLLLGEGGFPASETSRYWRSSEISDEFLASGLEINRVWISGSRDPMRRFILPALWCGLRRYLELNSHLRHIFGAVALTDYPPDAAERVTAHFARFHGAPRRIFEPIRPAPVGSFDRHTDADGMAEMARLNEELRSRTPNKGVPPLLYLYASVGMTVLADPGYDETGRGVLIPVHVRVENLAQSFVAMRRNLREAS